LLHYHFKDLFDDCNASELASLCILAPCIRGNKDIVNVKAYSLNKAKFNRKKQDYKFDLFIRKDVSKEPYDRILTIKFVLDRTKLSTKTKVNDIKHLDYVGFTLNAKINKKSTLDDIIDAHLGESRKYLASCYRVKIGDKLIAIPMHKRSDYRPYYEFMRDNNGDFIIFKVKTCSGAGVYLPIYS